ncbi:regulator of G-protein signaling 18 [Pimephales promelas]|uniref:regulator of G-protein signaling 18 n=1 Tax=Pimephales promelas TaxID=90988 RepID=UPI0019555151|nr:regulator of G-protein signaling 18 [Pimephales promelas]KAG1931919.1 regulator of G-protein signaling [Pimephales promelas]
MKIFVFLFPQFNFSAPKEEAYFKMLSEDELLACEMKENHSRNKKSRLSLLLTKSGSHENVSPDKKPPAKPNHIAPDMAMSWSDSFEELLSHSDGVEVFTRFLRTEFSEENIEFWLACEDFKTTESATKLKTKAKQIHAIFIDKEAPKEINIDHSTKAAIEKNILQPTTSCFNVAQDKIYSLMKRDCYPRFLTSDIYLTLTKRTGPRAMTRRRSRSFVFNERPDGTAAW